MEKKVKKAKSKAPKVAIPEYIIFPRLCYDKNGKGVMLSKEEFEKSGEFEIFKK